MARRQADWFTIGMESWLVGLEATRVIWLRSWLIALGGAAGEREARRMVEEKLAAAGAYGQLMMTGRAGASPEAVAQGLLRHYGRRVRANGWRLTRD